MGECTEKEIGECVWLVCKKNGFRIGQVDKSLSLAIAKQYICIFKCIILSPQVSGRPLRIMTSSQRSFAGC